MSYAISVRARSTIALGSHRSAWPTWTGRVLSGLAVILLLFDAAMKLFSVPVAVEGTVKLGYPAGVLVALGAVQIVCLAVSLIPRIAPLGAVLWTGYLGAIATHVRVESPLFTHVLFPIYVASRLWGGLCPCDARVRDLLAPRAQ